MKRTAIAIIVGGIGVVALWPSAAIIMWAMLNGGFNGPVQGIWVAAVSGPLSGAFIVGAAWIFWSREK
jgi:energy-converting hydrogenase Eha subunit C